MGNWHYWMVFFHKEKRGLVWEKYVSNWSVRHSNYPRFPLFSETNSGSTGLASPPLVYGKFFVIKSERKLAQIKRNQNSEVE